MHTDRPAVLTENRAFGRYIVQRKLGAGGAATVYQAYDQVLGRTVALKILGTAAEAGALNRFQREALMAGRLEHPNIVRTLQVGLGKQGSAPYIAMELVEGESLADLLARVGRLSPVDSCRLLAPIGHALAYAHAAGIVHRDVKPSNVLLQPVPARPTRTTSTVAAAGVELDILGHPVHPLLSDFGIARALDAPELTHIGRTVGTPAYMSPEQCAGSRTIDGRTDIYALGAVLFRCILGRPPFGGNTHQILHAHVYSPLTLDADALAALPPQVVTLLQHSLAKAPEDRFDHAGSMVTLMEEVAHLPPALRGQAAGPHAPIDATQTLDIPVQSESSAGTTILVPAPDEQPTPSERPAPQTPVAQDSNSPAAPNREMQPATPMPVDSEFEAAAAWSARIPRGVLALLCLFILVGSIWPVRDQIAWPAPRAFSSQTVPGLFGDTSNSAHPAKQPTSTDAAIDGQPLPATSASEPAQAAPPAPTSTATADAAVEAAGAEVDAAIAAVAVPSATPAVTSTPVAPHSAAGTEPVTTPVSEPTATEPASVDPPAETLPALPSAGLNAVPTLLPESPESELAIACAATVDPFFINHPALADSGPAGDLTVASFACPSDAASHTRGYVQRFTHGSLIQLHDQPFVYVYYQQSGAWEQAILPAEPSAEDSTEDSTGDRPEDSNADELPAPTDTASTIAARFARLWEAPHRTPALGTPVDPEPLEHDFVLQRYPHGLLIGDRVADAVYILLRDRLRL